MHVLAFLASLAASAALAAESIQLDPFAQATSGDAACPPAQTRLYTIEDAGAQAHALVSALPWVERVFDSLRVRR